MAYGTEFELTMVKTTGDIPIRNAVGVSLKTMGSTNKHIEIHCIPIMKIS